MPIHIGNLTAALAVLTSMITPALLISVCGALILSTSNRVGQVVDCVRTVSDQFKGRLVRGAPYVLVVADQRDERAGGTAVTELNGPYLAALLFVSASVAIGWSLCSASR